MKNINLKAIFIFFITLSSCSKPEEVKSEKQDSVLAQNYLWSYYSKNSKLDSAISNRPSEQGKMLFFYKANLIDSFDLYVLKTKNNNSKFWLKSESHKLNYIDTLLVTEFITKYYYDYFRDTIYKEKQPTIRYKYIDNSIEVIPDYDSIITPRTRKYYLKDGNIVKMDFQGSIIEYIEFDKYKNPFQNFKGLNKLVDFYNFSDLNSVISQNNPTKIIKYGESIEYKNEYNSNLNISKIKTSKGYIETFKYE